jgi:2-methylisocitrate lyase-like PEP mutase family enzyme
MIGAEFRERSHAAAVNDVRISLEANMNQFQQSARAAQFRALNEARGLLLPNAWDAASACIFQEAGFPAIGTTSAGIAYARGLRDAQHIAREAMAREIASIVAAVERPVTADIEAGYGPAPADVAMTVEAILDAGAVGVNLEDNTHGATEAVLFAIDIQAERIAAARSTAERRGIALVINARTDTFLMQVGDDTQARIEMTVERGRAYLKAGADLVFVPMLIEPAVVRRVADAIAGPISLMAVPGAPPAAALFAAGAARVSIGPAAMLATLGLLREIAAELRGAGTWNTIERSFFGFREAEALFARA